MLAALLVFAVCALGPTAGAELVLGSRGVTILVPELAVLTAALLLFPFRMWSVFVFSAAAGTLAAPLFLPRSSPSVALVGTLTVVGALVTAGGLALVGWRRRMGGLRDMALFLAFSGVLGPAAGVTVATGAFGLADGVSDPWVGWPAWLLASVLAGVAVLPAILVLARVRVSRPESAGIVRLAEAVTLVVGLTVVGLQAFGRGAHSDAFPIHLYGPLPLLVWAAVRFGSTGAIVAVSATTALAIEGAVSGRGPFLARFPGDEALHLQLFLLAISVPVLLLSAVVEELRGTAVELRQGQARYRSVVEDQTEMICRFLPDGTYTFVNGAYCRAFDRSPEDLLGRSFWMFIPPKGRHAAETFLSSITPANPVATLEHEVIGPNGELRWQQWTDRGFFDENGRIVEFQAVGRDVTDRKRAEEGHRLFESQRRVEETLRESDRRKDEFLAMLAHELRNPLAPIALAVELMRTQPLTEEASSARDMIARQLFHLSRLVDDLLDISRIRMGKITLTCGSVDVVGVVGHAVETIRPVMDSCGHQLVVSLPGTALHTWGDAARLGQIVANLLDNAAKYTEPGGRVYVVVTEERGDVLVTVGDNGVGIEPDQIPRIFDPFTQLRSTLATTHGGLGIGLTLVKRLVDLHGGQISARSAGPGEGSEFVVRLPLDPAPERAAPRAVPPPSRCSKAERERAGLRVLVVDDNVDAATSLARVLSVWGHTVHVASDGPDALEAETAFAPDAVLLDLGLPRLDGLEVARVMRKRHGADPLLLVALTGYGQPSDRRRTADAGFDHHFTKPVDIETLHAMLSTWDVRHREALEELRGA